MKDLKPGILLIAVALVWAAVMLAVRKALPGPEGYEAIRNYLVVGWFVSHLLIISLASSRDDRREWRCLRRWLGARFRDSRRHR